VSTSGATGAKVVLLDVDDTLVPWQTVAHWQWAWRPKGPVLSERHVLAAIRRSLHAWDRRRWQGVIGEAPPADVAAHRQHLEATLTAVAGHALPPAETEAVVHRFLHPAGEIETFTDALPCLNTLTAEGIRVAAVTHLPEESARYALRRAGLGTVEVVVAGDRPVPPIPAPTAFRAAAEALATKPRDILVVGDLFWSDVRAAARLGFRTLYLDRRDWAAKVLSARARTLAEVAPTALKTAMEPPPSAPESEGPAGTPAPDGPGPNAPGDADR